MTLSSGRVAAATSHSVSPAATGPYSPAPALAPARDGAAGGGGALGAAAVVSAGFGARGGLVGFGAGSGCDVGALVVFVPLLQEASGQVVQEVGDVRAGPVVFALVVLQAVTPPGEQLAYRMSASVDPFLSLLCHLESHPERNRKEYPLNASVRPLSALSNREMP